MAIKMKPGLIKSKRPLKFEELEIGDIFTTKTTIDWYMKTECVADDDDCYGNTVNLATGLHETFDNDTSVIRYKHEIEITYSADDVEDFI